MVDDTLRHTPLYDLHLELGARMVPFAGHLMPVQYPMGVLEEHQHTRQKAGLFDVSHMGQLRIRSKQAPEQGGADAARAFERLVPMDIAGLKPGRQRYALLTNEQGGIRDDLMVARFENDLFIVVNAACKETDSDYIEQNLGEYEVIRQFDRALLALQGPKAVTVLEEFFPGIAAMSFMDIVERPWNGAIVSISRSGYTGEDGFEIGLPAEYAEDFARKLLAHPDVAPVGLGARDSLRLEAGLCLYGHDIDVTTTPIEAGLLWAIQKIRRPGGAHEGNYPGAEIIARQLAHGTERQRVGIEPEGRAPVREGTALFADEAGLHPAGHVTSGGFGPTCGRPVAMGYVDTAHHAEGTKLFASLRGRMVPVTICRLPFVPSGFKRQN